MSFLSIEEEEEEDMAESNHRCNVVEDGVCGFHGVEIERRKNSEEKIKKIPFMLTAVNRIIGFMTLFSMLIAASFIYTKDVSNAVIEHTADSKRDVKKLDEEIKTLATAVVRVEEKYVALLRELENLNGQIRILIRNSSERAEGTNGVKHP